MFELPDLVCVRCGGSFTPRQRNQTVCSVACRKRPLAVTRPRGRTENLRVRTRKPAPPGMVACSRCDFVGPEGEWKTRKYTYKGVSRVAFESWCTECRRVARRAEYWASPEAARAAAREWVRANPVRFRENARLTSRAYAARKRGAPCIPYSFDQLTARLSMFGFRCWMCGAPATTVDHVKPLAAGGYDCLSNFRPACKTCNCAKGGTWPFDTRLRPRVPRTEVAS